MIVKAYPQPSQKYGEAVCTAGITQDGKWIRIYPVEFRQLPPEAQFEKWHWIEARIKKSSSDPRPESYNIDYDSIKVLGKIGTANQWEQRRKILKNFDNGSLEKLEELHNSRKVSLGAIKPKTIEKFFAEPVEREWRPEKLALLKARNENNLFSTRKRTLRALEKVPYKFSYKFHCEDPDCSGHTLQVLDWEVAQSFRNWMRDYKSEEVVLQKMQEKYFDEFSQKDLMFILGTIKSVDKFGVFSIIGLFYPPKRTGPEQLSIFT